MGILSVGKMGVRKVGIPLLVNLPSSQACLVVPAVIEQSIVLCPTCMKLVADWLIL